MSKPMLPAHPAFPKATLPATLGIILVILLAFGAHACESLAGGPVLSVVAYRDRVAETKAAGERALSDLEPIPTTSGGSLDRVFEKSRAG